MRSVELDVIELRDHVARLQSGGRCRPGLVYGDELASIRGRIVVVAIYPEPQPVRLFDVFWKELQLRGARVYEPEDFERAIELLAAEVLPLERLISSVEPLERLPVVIAEMAAGASGIKTLVDCTT